MTQPPPAGPIRILHLEDDPNDSELLSMILADENIPSEVHRVETRTDFENALEKRGWNLVISDYSLRNHRRGDGDRMSETRRHGLRVETAPRPPRGRGAFRFHRHGGTRASQKIRGGIATQRRAGKGNGSALSPDATDGKHRRAGQRHRA